jgi:hydroxymethylbilane synthase
MAQAVSVSAWLRDSVPGLEVEIVPIKTSGDRGEREVVGAFVKEIQHALLEEAVDVGLHCLKDLPVEDVPGLQYSAYLEREDPRDTLISRDGKLADLPGGAVVGTGSLRRSAQLAAIRPDLKFKPIYGNIDTRLGKLISGEYDAIILAIAGLLRLDLMSQWKSGPYAELAVEPLSMEEMLPAAGQAVLILETRASDSAAIDAAGTLHHEPTALEAKTERTFLKSFGGGCSLPVAARALIENEVLSLQGLVASPDGTTVLRDGHSGPTKEGQVIAAELAERLTQRGARKILESIQPVGATR